MMRQLAVAVALCAVAFLAACDDDGAECSGDLEECDGACVDPMTSTAHCGACGAACDSGESCVDGSCTLVCPDGLELCDDACVDTDVDPEHCGDCETACGTGESCAGGECRSPCPTGQVDCDGVCTDTDRDRDNCGDCGTECSTAEACIDGDCTLLCAAGQTECDGACYDLDADPGHCGDCDTACAAGEACVDGDCELACGGSTPTLCVDSCVDTGSNPDFCGDCDTACADGEVCDTGSCELFCSAPLTECDSACVDTSSNPAFCGDCDTACADGTNALGTCVDGSCRLVCATTHGDCNFDLESATGDGCETDVTGDVDNCGACGHACVNDHGGVTCTASDCEVTSCDTGWGDCNADGSDGCEADFMTDSAHCGDCTTACAATETCFDGDCVAIAGEDCSDAIALVPGMNTILWTATTADYVTTTPSCVAVGSVEGPDVVLTYTASTAGPVEITMLKPTNQRFAMVVSDAACGTVTELACASEYFDPTMTASFTATAGTTYYVYAIDTSSGSDPLPNPLEIIVHDCSAAPPLVSLEPEDATTTTTLSPTFTATFAGGIDTTVGTITLTGDVSTSLSYDLSTSPSEVSFSSGDAVMEIDPGIAFPAGENVTITWTALVDALCGTAVPAPTWVVTIVTPPCTPGTGGMVGTTTATLASGPAGTDYYVAADDDPSGYVYMGGTSELWRQPKAGGAVEDVEAAAGLTTSNLGYAMLIDGDDIYTIDSLFTTTTDATVWRISTDGGSTWTVEDYVAFPTAPGDDIRGAAAYGGRIYLLTEESSSSDTEIWSVAAGSTSLPETATLETTFTGYSWCNSIALDDNYYYLSCSSDELLRIDRTTGAETVIGTFDISSTNGQLYADDLDSDGTADVLYLQSWEEIVWYVCEPDSATPYSDVLYEWGTGTGNYGMGFDPVANVLWVYDDDDDEFTSIQ